MSQFVSVPEILVTLILIICMLFGYSYYESSHPKSGACAVIKVLGLLIILGIVGSLTQTAANVII